MLTSPQVISVVTIISYKLHGVGSSILNLATAHPACKTLWDIEVVNRNRLYLQLYVNGQRNNVPGRHRLHYGVCHGPTADHVVGLSHLCHSMVPPDEGWTGVMGKCSH